MAVPTQFANDLQQAAITMGSWLEIEGIPYAFGSFPAAASFFSARAANQRFEGIKQYLAKLPRTLSQSIDVLEGGSLTVGVVDFELVDVNDEITALTGIGNTAGGAYTQNTVTETSTMFQMTNSMGLVAGDIFHIGTEAIKIGAVVPITGTVVQFTGCTRGWYRTKPQAFPGGFPVAPRPVVMANRRCWFHQQVAAGPGALHSTLTDPTRCIRFSGTLRNLSLGDKGSSYVLTAQSMDKELDRNAFRRFRKFKLSSAIADATGTPGPLQVTGWPGYWPGYDIITNFPASEWSIGETALIRIDEEVFAVERLPAWGGYIPQMRLLARGLLSTKVVRHEAGAQCTEIIGMVYRDGSGTWTPFERGSKFTSTPTAASPLPADHPLLLVLQVLLSTGKGTNYVPGQRNYDVLPADWGMGIDVSRVDVAAIELAAAEDPTPRFGGVIDEPINFVAWMRSILKLAGYYHLILLQDQFTIKRLRPNLPDKGYTNITNANRIFKYQTGWDANWGGAVRELIYKYGWDIDKKTFRNIAVFVLGDADLYAKGLAQTKTFECKYVYPGNSGTPGEPPFRQFDVDQWLLGRRDFFETRYGRPPPIITERVDFNYLLTEVGDLVAVTHANLPDVKTGARSITNAIGEVINKSVDDRTKTVDLTILITGWSVEDYRYIGGVDFLDTNMAWDGWFAYTYNWADPSRFRSLADALQWRRLLVNNGWARLWKTDMSVYYDLPVLDGDDGFIQLDFSSHGFLDPNEGYWITESTYDLSGNTRQVTAHLAPSTELLGTPLDKVHRLFPT